MIVMQNAVETRPDLKPMTLVDTLTVVYSVNSALQAPLRRLRIALLGLLSGFLGFLVYLAV